MPVVISRVGSRHRLGPPCRATLLWRVAVLPAGCGLRGGLRLVTAVAAHPGRVGDGPAGGCRRRLREDGDRSGGGCGEAAPYGGTLRSGARLVGRCQLPRGAAQETAAANPRGGGAHPLGADGPVHNLNHPAAVSGTSNTATTTARVARQRRPMGCGEAVPHQPPTQPGGPRHQTPTTRRGRGSGQPAVHSLSVDGWDGWRPMVVGHRQRLRAEGSRQEAAGTSSRSAPIGGGSGGGLRQGQGAARSGGPVAGRWWVTVREVNRELWTSVGVGRGCGVGGGSPSGATPSRSTGGSAGGCWVGCWVVAVAGRAAARWGGCFCFLGGCGGRRLWECVARAARGGGL